MKPTFLTAEWRKLAIANYYIDPEILKPYLPEHTELDLWNSKCFVSLVAFRFLNTKLKGIPIPFHSDFEEVNLRFYVRHKHENGWRRGAVFIKEIVPKPAISFVARTIYGEPYVTMPMKHKWELTEKEIFIDYQWKFKNNWNRFSINANSIEMEIPLGSETEFITEHYWGYTKKRKGITSEYGVEHPRWKMYQVKDHSIHLNFEKLYGQDFKSLDQLQPKSVMLAEGSEILIRSGRIINL